MAALSLAGPGPFRASTPAIQTQVLALTGKTDVVAHGRVVLRDRELSWVAVEVAAVTDGRVRARGTVIYRIAPRAGG